LPTSNQAKKKIEHFGVGWLIGSRNVPKYHEKTKTSDIQEYEGCVQ
jgi:hypothetical protein